MQRPSGTAAVRLSLWTVLAVALVVALLEPATAGTESAPEIQDATGDVEIVVIPGCAEGLGCTSDAIDLVTLWIEGENATHLPFNIRANGDIVGGLQDIPLGAATFDVTFTVGGTESTATVSVDADGITSVSGVATSATVNGTLLVISVAKAGIGSPAAGATLTGLSVASELAQALGPVPLGLPFGSDSAAAAEGTTYTFTGGSAGPGPCPACTPEDTDGDGLNDTWEQQYFGNLTQNATDDPDGDGLTNGQEEALGTDPTEADTDGDGVNDKDDPFPTDPTRGGSSTTSSTTTTTRPPTTTTTTSTSRSTTNSVPQGEDGDGDVESLDDAVEKLRSDPGYLGLSGGGFLAVLILCIIALAVRWSL